jgi:hypothetical protein
VFDMAREDNEAMNQLREMEVLTMTGEEVVTVVHDWDGRRVEQARPTVSEQEELFDLVRKQSEEMKALQAQLLQVTRANEALASSDVTEDRVGPAVASKARRTRKTAVVEEDVVPFGADA